MSPKYNVIFCHTQSSKSDDRSASFVLYYHVIINIIIVSLSTVCVTRKGEASAVRLSYLSTMSAKISDNNLIVQMPGHCAEKNYKGISVLNMRPFVGSFRIFNEVMICVASNNVLYRLKFVIYASKILIYAGLY